MKHLLKEINEVLDASRQDTLVAIAFLHGMKTALMLGLNQDEKEPDVCKENKQ